MGKAAKGGCTGAALALDADSTRLQSLARHRHAARAMQARCGGQDFTYDAQIACSWKDLIRSSPAGTLIF